MRDRILIYAGLGLFILLISYPVWFGFLTNATAAGPDIRGALGVGGGCVAPKSEMRKAHMTMLMEWRDGKIRQGQRSYPAYDGKEYDVNLTGTCLTRCHGGDHEKFCDRCHSFAGVPTTDCWGCHAAPPTPAVTLTGGKR